MPRDRRNIREALIRRLNESRPDLILLAQCQRNIERGGDGERKYKGLWATGRTFQYRTRSGRKGTARSYRDGGRPLRDTGAMMSGLSSTMDITPTGVRLGVRGPLIAVYHQHGFTTTGPNFIPLNRKAVRTHRKGNNPADEGLVLNKDYVMAWRGVTVPARRIFNPTAADIQEILEAIADASA